MRRCQNANNIKNNYIWHMYKIDPCDLTAGSQVRNYLRFTVTTSHGIITITRCNKDIAPIEFCC